MIAFVILFALGFTLEKPTRSPSTRSSRAPGAGAARARATGCSRSTASRPAPARAASRPTGSSARSRAPRAPASRGRRLPGDEAGADRRRAATARRQTIEVRPFYDAEAERFRFGFAFVGAGLVPADRSIPSSADFAVDRMWEVTSQTIGIVGADLRRRAAQADLRDRRQLRGHPAVDRVRHPPGALRARPDQPLAGGDQPVPVPAARRRPHLLGLVEKVRGKRGLRCGSMERASVVGFALVLMLFAIGLSNDIGRLSGEGFEVR